MRIFNTIDKSKLRHLRDCIECLQNGKRSHSNEINGSDLDGNEYAVLWLDLVIQDTDNFEPYDDDSQEPSVSLSSSMIHDDIVDVVSTISEQDYQGKLCCTHLGYIDKAGNHPLSEQQSITNHFADHPEEKDSSYNIWTTIEDVPIDAYLIHPSYHQYMPSSLDQCISKHIDVADSSQVELKTLMNRIKALFYTEFHTREEVERSRISMNATRYRGINMRMEGEANYLDEKLANASYLNKTIKNKATHRLTPSIYSRADTSSASPADEK
ncbi:unnamed protein product [Rotaria socialis]|uniref:RNA-dependent RNA polymerase n=1 Tax=Rotaria socialis TaxID=392032 RepID=A0A819W251_9BILA|nr:unnamed protein product [Rotaria socialis]